MNKRSVEALVGLFMMLGFAALIFLAIQVSGLNYSSKQETYKLFAQFHDLGGLTVRGKVSMSGVEIGKVSAISLDPQSYNALVEMNINKNIDKLSKDSIASIQTAGLLGEKYISISVGGEDKYLANGDTIFDTQSALNLEKLIGAFASGKMGK